MTLKPLHDRVIVEPAAKEEISAGGIILPDTAQEKPRQGTVIAVGPGKTLDNGTLATPDVAEGDEVLYGKYSGTEVKVGGRDLVIIRADEILGIVTKETAAKGKKAKAGAKK